MFSRSLLRTFSRSLRAPRCAITAPRAFSGASVDSESSHDDFKPVTKKTVSSSSINTTSNLMSNNVDSSNNDSSKLSNDSSEISIDSRISSLVKSSPVVVFMKGDKSAPRCGFSYKVVQVLNAEGAEFEAVNVLEDEGIRQGIKDFTGWPTIPQVFVDAEFIGGCDIVYEMYENGDLETLLKEKGIVKEDE